MGVENNLSELSMNQVVEVATSKPMSKVKTQEATKPDKLNIRKKKRFSVKSIQNK